MDQPAILRVYLHHPLLHTAQQGKLGFVNRLRSALEGRGWQVEICQSGNDARRKAPDLPGYALFHMERPTHDRALTFRLAYHYPFWRIEQRAERWRWPVAKAGFEPAGIDRAEAHDFASKLRARVLPGPAPTSDGPVLIALQGRIRKHRSFQSMSPVEMVETVARAGQPCVATLHPKEIYDKVDRAALDRLAQQFPNLTIGGETAALLRTCPFVVTQNSAVAFDGYVLGKPAVLFAQVDFHHIALNVGTMDATEALQRARNHAPDYDRYLDWFLRRQSLDMMAPDSEARILAALRSGGIPV